MQHFFLLYTVALCASSISKRVSAADPVDCITDPTQDACADYQYPPENAVDDMNSLCKSMPYMPGCTLRNTCNDHPDLLPAAVCDKFNLLATICKVDSEMAGMKGCKNYNQLCSNGPKKTNPASKVKQCAAVVGAGEVPTTRQCNDASRSVCREMWMDGCDACTPDWDAGKTFATCDLLTTYSYLCYSMPEMKQCSLWHAMCKQSPDLYLCTGDFPAQSGGGSDIRRPPVMKMYFNDDLPFYLLFKNWTPYTTQEYAGAWIAIFLLGLVYEGFNVLRHNFEALHMSAKKKMTKTAVTPAATRTSPRDGLLAATPTPLTCCSNGNGNGNGASEQMERGRQQCCNTQAGAAELTAWEARVGGMPVWCVNACRGALQFIIMGIGYLLMLGAMCFNTGIFFAVIGGVAFATAVLAPFKLHTDDPNLALAQHDCCG